MLMVAITCIVPRVHIMIEFRVQHRVWLLEQQLAESKHAETLILQETLLSSTPSLTVFLLYLCLTLSLCYFSCSFSNSLSSVTLSLLCYPLSSVTLSLL